MSPFDKLIQQREQFADFLSEIEGSVRTKHGDNAPVYLHVASVVVDALMCGMGLGITASRNNTQDVSAALAAMIEALIGHTLHMLDELVPEGAEPQNLDEFNKFLTMVVKQQVRSYRTDPDNPVDQD